MSNQNGCQRLWGWQSIDVASKAAGSQSCRVLVWLGTEPWRVTDRPWPRPSLPPPYSPFLQQIPLVYLLHSLVNIKSQLMLVKKSCSYYLQITWIWCIEASQGLSVSSAMNLVLSCFFNSLPCALTVQGSEVNDWQPFWQCVIPSLKLTNHVFCKAIALQLRENEQKNMHMG